MTIIRRKKTKPNEANKESEFIYIYNIFFFYIRLYILISFVCVFFIYFFFLCISFTKGKKFNKLDNMSLILILISLRKSFSFDVPITKQKDKAS